MSNFFKPKEFKDFNEAPAPVQLPDGSYEPVLTDEDLKICSRRMCLMDTVSYSYATQNAPCAMFASYYALRKIYGNDEDAFNTAILNQLDCVFNATPPVSGLLLGAGLAMEDKGTLTASMPRTTSRSASWAPSPVSATSLSGSCR